MSKIVKIQHADDPRDVIHKTVQGLAEGMTVGFPTETGYVIGAHALIPSAMQRLAEFQAALASGPALLALKGAAESLDYVPGMSELGRKLTRRLWPGPVVLLFDFPTEGGLADALPEITRRLVTQSGGIALRVAAHDILAAVLRLMPAPLVLAGETLAGGTLHKDPESFEAAAGGHLDLLIHDGPCRYGQPSTIVRVAPSGWNLVQEGVITHRMLSRLAGEMYLFICTGNTCRSPMAEALFRKMLSERLHCAEEDLVDRGYVVASAGLAAAMGSPPSPEAVQILAQRGIDLHGHESQPVTPRLLNQADHIFTMTNQHRECIVRELPELAPRVSLLARDGIDVSDPIGFGLEDYQKCADEIEQHLRAILSDLPV